MVLLFFFKFHNKNRNVLHFKNKKNSTYKKLIRTMVPNVISHRYVLNAGLNMFDRLNEISKKNDDEANNEDEDEVDDEALFFL